MINRNAGIFSGTVNVSLTNGISASPFLLVGRFLNKVQKTTLTLGRLQQSAHTTSRIINCYFGRIVSNFYTHKGMQWLKDTQEKR